MASSELRSRQRRLEPVESVPPTATVRHVDQLDTETLDYFYDAVENGRALPADGATNLEVGEIIVFNGYVRVERA
ncbi:hypothetical protein C493_15223 [Natronolimnohabitans innermongolicus JCM 12255]|uniref:DUF7979 domain-containing protein n=2 Tax=Natronolimnohabitans innermongolicus TaxID=253107 RepID=L9WU26_9EURY|nr:hypothetical protein C493_15223 [Natronolimnohabitans innermongolicus JCM 12255]